MPKSDKLSSFGLYCKEDLCRRLVTDGYTEVSFGGGPWVGPVRIVGVSAFFHPSGSITTLLTQKEDDGVANHRTQGEMQFTGEEFAKFITDWQIHLGERLSIQDLLITIAS